MIVRIVFNCYFQMTMTIWVESGHSDSQELNLIKDTPRELIHGQFSNYSKFSFSMTKLEYQTQGVSLIRFNSWLSEWLDSTQMVMVIRK